MSEVDAQKFEAFVRGLQDPFGNPAAAEGLLDSGPAIVGDAGAEVPGNVVTDLTPNSGLPAPAPPIDQTLPSEPPSAEATAQLHDVQAAIAESLGAAGLEDLASFRFDGRGLVLSLGTDDVLFASGSTEISDLGKQVIAAVAAPLTRFGNDIFVEGHTDDVPLNRGGYTNWNLSTDRAVAVVGLLAATHGISQDRLGAAGYGEYRPRVPNDSPEHRALNRRVDVLIVAKQGATDG
jgi:chemotaxis protein MotB